MSHNKDRKVWIDNDTEVSLHVDESLLVGEFYMRVPSGGKHIDAVAMILGEKLKHCSVKSVFAWVAVCDDEDKFYQKEHRYCVLVKYNRNIYGGLSKKSAKEDYKEVKKIVVHIAKGYFDLLYEGI